MKRIKPDEIQKKVEIYLKKRNYTSSTNTTIDLNAMALNGLTSMESTIHDYYLYSSIYSTSMNDYFKQYCTYIFYNLYS
jgi:hypothetical protein